MAVQQSGLTATDVLAIIGAVTGITGTLLAVGALIWDFYKWRYAERVRLRVWATPGFANTVNPQDKLISISVTNIGKIPTTLKLLSFHGFDSKKELKKRNGKDVSINVSPLYPTGPLPYRLEPGNEWNEAIDQRQPLLLKYLKHKYFIVQVEDTISEKPFRAEIDKKRFRESLAE
ncbi:MAG TPA: hypothetical protein VK557_08065 [Pyrinomonadaceae bacterium]|nr:hypothetical protein [Pyrinomonadaceae bacterium]